MQQAKNGSNLVVISIFVNPLQFGPREDFRRYPRNLKGDAGLAKTAGVDIIFAPTIKEMYDNTFPPERPTGRAGTFVDMSNLTDKLCGKTVGHY